MVEVEPTYLSGLTIGQNLNFMSFINSNDAVCFVGVPECSSSGAMMVHYFLRKLVKLCVPSYKL